MKILIGGIGNIFSRDDGFGCEVVRRLSDCDFPEDVTVKDFGIGSYDLAFALASDFDAVILVDAMPRGGEPGTIYLMELEPAETEARLPMDGRAMGPVAVVQMARAVGSVCGKLFLVGCEPENCGNDKGKMGLSPEVEEAIPQALAAIDSLLADLQIALFQRNKPLQRCRNGQSLAQLV